MSHEDDEIKRMIGQMDPIRNSVMNACKAGSLPLLEVLIEGGGDVNTANHQGVTILMTACEKGYTDIVKFLLKKGADIHLQDNDGRTALDIAVEAHQDEIAGLLRAV